MIVIIMLLALISYLLMLINKNLKDEEYEIEQSKPANSDILKIYKCFICKKEYVGSETEEKAKNIYHRICSDKCREFYKNSGFEGA